MSKTVENSCLEAAEILRKIAKDYFKLAKNDPRFEEHYNSEGERAVKLANWYFNRSKMNEKLPSSDNSVGTSSKQSARSVPGT